MNVNTNTLKFLSIVPHTTPPALTMAPANLCRQQESARLTILIFVILNASFFKVMVNVSPMDLPPWQKL